MIEHGIRPEEVHRAVKALSRELFEEGILLSGGPHSVYDVAALVELVHHGVDRIDVVLQIRVH